MLGERKGEKVVLCDKCGGVISWSVNSNLKHGYICTKCIDKDYGKFRVLDLHRFELERLGVKADKLSDDKMAEVSEELSHRILLGPYWSILQTLVNESRLVQ